MGICICSSRKSLVLICHSHRKPAGLMTKGQGFVLTPVLLQEWCCAPVALMQELGGFLVLLKYFSGIFSFAKISTIVWRRASKPRLIESCRMDFWSQSVHEYTPFPSHRWFFMVASPVCHTLLCCLSRSFMYYCFLCCFQAIQNSYAI